jgi:hypothetical protein
VNPIIKILTLPAFIGWGNNVGRGAAKSSGCLMLVVAAIVAAAGLRKR